MGQLFFGKKWPKETFVSAGLTLKLKFQGQPTESCARSARGHTSDTVVHQGRSHDFKISCC